MKLRDDVKKAVKESGIKKAMFKEWESEFKASLKGERKAIVLDGELQHPIFKRPVDWRVPPEACLPIPPFYRIPEHGTLKEDIEDALASITAGNNVYIYGLPGTGKDALIHAFSGMLRIPTKIFQVRPNADIEPWLYYRSFDQEGTTWTEGDLLKALRDGYTSPKTGDVIPYLILLTDFDRATPDQAEIMRMIMDSIEGRVPGPDGEMYPLLKGTQIICTGNSAGSGDMRRRCVSSQLMDASLLDRFEAVFEFQWMDWKDEVEILRNKFPLFCSELPKAIPVVGKCVDTIRSQIEEGEIFFELSHRGICRWIRQVENLLRNGYPKETVLQRAARVVFDTASSPDVKMAVKRLMDSHLDKGVL